MPSICVNTLIGLPASGKTSYSKFLLEHFKYFNVIHICYDDFIKIDNDPDRYLDGQTYKNERKLMLKFLDLLIEDLNETKNEARKFCLAYFGVNFDYSLDKDKILIIIDDNMYFRSQRYEILQIARKRSVGFFQTFFDFSLEEVLRRNSERSFKIKDEIIRKMDSKLEKPNGSIYNWEQKKLMIELGQEIHLNKIKEIAYERIRNPEILTENGNKCPIEQTSIHKIDLQLRKAVSQRLKSSQGQELSTLAKDLNEKRRIILDDVRSGNIQINYSSTLNFEDLL